MTNNEVKADINLNTQRHTGIYREAKSILYESSKSSNLLQTVRVLNVLK